MRLLKGRSAQYTGQFLIGHPDLHVAVDHQPLLGIVGGGKDMSDVNNHRLIEFSRKIAMFQPFTVMHIPGTKNLAADAGLATARECK